jgi:hypothetical protein
MPSVLVLACTKAKERLAKQVPALKEVSRERADKTRAVVTMTKGYAVFKPAVLVCLALAYVSDKALAVAMSPFFWQRH